jgi:hypothetical protein
LSSRATFDRAVEHFADREAAVAVRRLQVGRIDRVFRALAFRQFAHARPHQRLERFQPFAGEGVDPPGLDIAGRGRARRALHDLAYGFFGDGRRQERTAGISAGDGVAHMHEGVSGSVVDRSRIDSPASAR